MSSTNHPASLTKGAKDMRKTRNPALTLHILEIVLTQYLFPECTWDNVEECVGWCREVMVDPAPLRRIGREWRERAVGMRTLLEALFVRSEPRKVLLWDYRGPSCYRNPARGDHREGPGLASGG